ncbi:DUF2790 domain-containing protein [Pseudomonas sp. ZM23]|uniref:DUF2790 domain-containing protein n=1 Tax=Pseudomonas triclosanedens TaxID=2961893 RepID=A0ABY7A7D5_9PSED|nr:DUF2790 domain-containing protein [Pseudomonas triclosanedens]MCP8466369.1 DUF2790 domain-containing protein [Pseudomonas triclosanedens]MCP8471895.1 DUF2790 domain-containing protein [Pseudomonas triclosanedens]MCP8478590.1 DUF2790 domain-containing protein [Pseudomonas triclosanedens]WAI52215.1 DUF2790 domain-containing protein [Pseudomonas triclosanedens]
MKTLLAVACLALAGSAFATDGVPPAQDYHYDQLLDIHRVVRPADLSFCGIREVEMTYEDSAGQLHRLRYRAWGLDCANEN